MYKIIRNNLLIVKAAEPVIFGTKTDPRQTNTRHSKHKTLHSIHITVVCCV